MTKGIVFYLKSGYIIFDDQDFDLVASYNWRLNSLGYVVYLQYTKRVKRPKSLLLHRLILGVTNRNEVVDHINHNPRDNRRCNLRIATIQQNVRNRVSNKSSTSQYLGVSFDSSRKKWKAQIKATRESGTTTIGRFESEVDAALAYNEAALRYFGEFASLNKI